MFPHFADVSLAEMAGEPDLGLLWGHKHRKGARCWAGGHWREGRTDQRPRGRGGEALMMTRDGLAG